MASTTTASPKSPSRAVVRISTAAAGPDPAALLQSLDDKRRRRSTVGAAAAAAAAAGGGVGGATRSANNAAAQTQQQQPFDPIEFLNKHYGSEAAFASQLPTLRKAVTERMDLLDDRISTAMQRQSETAELTRRNVQEAKASVRALETRIRQVKERAGLSERAVLEITKDMKRLDCAKRHLQRTITTLKRLHMLVNAVEQLRIASLRTPFPDYSAASQLVGATRLLLTHFDAYTQKVEPMRLLSNKVGELQKDLRLSLVRGFRVVAFGIAKTREIEGTLHKHNSFTDPDDDEDEDDDADVPMMSTSDLEGGVLLVDALGEDVRTRFIHEFCQDHLAPYLKEFEPPSKEVPQQRVSSFRVQETNPEDEMSVAGLECIEKRYTWFRDVVVRHVDHKFPGIFPPHWNLQASMARHFLTLVRFAPESSRGSVLT